MSAAYTASWSLTHWGRPRIETTFSWVLVGFLTCWATKAIPDLWTLRWKKQIPILSWQTEQFPPILHSSVWPHPSPGLIMGKVIPHPLTVGSAMWLLLGRNNSGWFWAWTLRSLLAVLYLFLYQNSSLVSLAPTPNPRRREAIPVQPQTSARSRVVSVTTTWEPSLVQPNHSQQL